MFKKNPEKKLSIITICYNAPYLEKTCESIANQTWKDFEWIVIDGGSDKEYLEIFEKYKHLMTVFVSERDKGIYNAQNKGLKYAKGEYVNFMNAGDAFHSFDTLEKIFAENKYKADVIYSDVNCVYNDGSGESYVVEKPANIDREFFRKYNFCGQCIFYKTDLFKKYGKFDEKFAIYADSEKNIKFFTKGASFVRSDVIIADFDRCGISSSPDNKLQRKEEATKIREKYFGVKNHPVRDFIFFRYVEKTHNVIKIFGIKIKFKYKK